MTINDFTLKWELYENTKEVIQLFAIDISAQEMEKRQKKKLPVLTYIEGYCCYSINKKLKCGNCNEQIVSCSGNVDDFQFTMMKGL